MTDVKQRADSAYTEIKNKLSSILQKAQANNSTIKKQDDDLGEAKRRIDEIKNRLEALKVRLVELIRVLKEKGSVSEELLARFDEINGELGQIEGIDFSDNSVSIAALLESISQLEAKVSELEGLADSENSGGNNAGERKMGFKTAANIVGRLGAANEKAVREELRRASLAYNDPQDPGFQAMLRDIEDGSIEDKGQDHEDYRAINGRNEDYQMRRENGGVYYYRVDNDTFNDGTGSGRVQSSYEHPSTYPQHTPRPTTGGKKRRRRKRKSKKTRRKRKSKKKGGYKFDAVAIKSRKSRLQTRKLNSRKRKRTKKKRRKRRRRR